jgi:hypothetical protein
MEMRAKVEDDGNATEARLIADGNALHASMSTEMHGVLGKLQASLQQLQNKEDTDYSELMGNLTSWQAAREIENARQREWLQRLKDTLQGSSDGIGGKINRLNAALKEADRRLTARGTALEQEQRATVSQTRQCAAAVLGIEMMEVGAGVARWQRQWLRGAGC